MKLQRIILLGIATLAIVLSRAAAQERKPVPPYLAPVPKSAHWTIKLAYAPQPLGKPAPSGTNPLLAINTVKGGDILLVAYTFQEASPMQIDRKGKYLIVRDSGGMRLFGAEGGAPLPFYTQGFLFADWVGRDGISAFRDVAEHLGVRCFHYVNNHAEGPQFDPGFGQEAWIDAETMLPVAAKWNGMEAVYYFEGPPASPIELPRDEADLIESRENAVKAASVLR